MKQNILDAAGLIRQADAVLVSASNGLSIAEGYHIFADNDDFKKYFGFFRQKYGIDCLIRGVFARIPEHDLYMHTVHQYMIDDYQGSQVMKDLLKLVGDKEYFVVTSNADTHFQINGFDPDRIFEVEGNFDGMDMYSPEWEAQNRRYRSFISRFQDCSFLILELGIGRHNTIIKKPLMNMTAVRPSWHYITLNMPGGIYIPDHIADRSIALPGDIAQTFHALLKGAEEL